jgi:outer membrane protein assembly factor BamA
MRQLLIALLILTMLLPITTSIRAQEKEEEDYYLPRDYGHDWRLGVLFGFTTEDGLLVAGGPILYEFAFRAFPYVYRMELVGGISTSGAFKFVYTGVFPSIGKKTSLDLFAQASEFEVRDFYGFGNSSPRDEDLERKDFYRVSSREYILRPTFHIQLASSVKLSLGAALRHFEVRLKADRFLTRSNLSMFGDDRTTVGAGASIGIDTRDMLAAASKGVYFLAQGWTYPDPFKSRAPFHKILGDGRIYLSLGQPSDVTLALRVRAEKIYGSFPFYESAFIGGPRSLRGYNRERFAGDAAVVGSAELRFLLFRMKLLVPTEVGLFALGDVGRVWIDGDSPGSLHTDAGGGIWLAPLQRAYTFSVAVASSVDGLFVRAGVGFGF